MKNRARSFGVIASILAVSFIGSVLPGRLPAQDMKKMVFQPLPDPALYIRGKVIDGKVDKNAIAIPGKIPPDQQMDAAVGKSFVVVEAVAQDVYPMGRNGFIFTLGPGKQALLWAEDVVDYLAAIKKSARVDMSHGMQKAIIGLKGQKLIFAGKVKRTTVEKGKKAGQVFTQVVVSPHKTGKFIIGETGITAKRAATVQ